VIVSLLPAATEIVSALGLAERLVGRSHECDFPDGVQALPALTRARVDSGLPSADLDEAVCGLLTERLPIYMLDATRLAGLAPDVVVTQAACEVCAVSHEQVVQSLKRTAYQAEMVTLSPSRLSHVLEDVRTVARACGVPERGDALAARLRLRLEALRATPLEPRPRVAVVEWLEPPMLAGHWVPDVIEAAGARHVGPTAGEPSPYVDWAAVKALAPDALVVAPCGFDLPRTVREARPLLARLYEVAPRVLLMDGNANLNRPGPRLVEAAEVITSWLRGEDVPEACAVDAAEEPLLAAAGTVPPGDAS
jgi:iron complex transport system substrate-binding protein